VSDILEEWVPRAYRFALRLSNDPYTAEDLPQETFLTSLVASGAVARQAGGPRLAVPDHG
jgi:DNA-directed RNA polymerase specialized sigma24 family protein